MNDSKDTNPNQQQLRFVVLLHEVPPSHARATHWDLMLEQESADLATWALDVEPNANGLANTAGIRCLRLPPHRVHYLTYEGPVSNNRGTVKRWASGFYRPRQWKNDEIKVELVSDRINGLFRLSLELPASSTESDQEKDAPKVWRLHKIG